MTTNIFRIFVVALFIAAATTVAAQQPFDPSPVESQPSPPAAQDEAPIRIPDDTTANPGFQTPDSQFNDDEPDQTVEVDEKYAGWWAAGEGTEGGRLSETLRANWVMADANGLVQGTVRGIDGAVTSNMFLYLLNRGRLVSEVVTDDQGNFELTNVIEGAYSLVGFGENAFFCFALNVLHHSEREVVNAPTRIDVLAFQNETTINLDWIRYFAPQTKFRVYGRYSVQETEDDPPAFYGFQGLALHQPAAAPATSISSHQVVKTADGRLLGRIHQLNSLSGRPVNLRNTKVMLLKGDEVFASTTTDYFGVFEFLDVPEDQYALVGAGVDGLGCIGIDVTDSSPAALTDPDADAGTTVFDFCLASSETVGWLNQFAIDLAYERAILAPREVFQRCKPYVPYCPQPQKKRFFRETAKVIDDYTDRRFYGPDNYDPQMKPKNFNYSFQDYYYRQYGTYPSNYYRGN